MKRILIGILLSFATLAYGGATDGRFIQRNLIDTGQFDRFVPFPTGGQQGIFWYRYDSSGTDPAIPGTQIPGTQYFDVLTIGSGFTITGNALSVSTQTLPNVGTAGTYSVVTTDAQGRVTSGINPSINDSPSRSLVTTTASTGFQISSSRWSRACYEGSISTTSTIGGPASASVFLETADTNSTTPGDWTTKAAQTYTNTITLAVVLNQVQANNWSFCRDIPAGKYVRIRSGSISGTASVTINSNQQETTM